MAIDEEITLKKMEVFLSFMKLGNMTKVSEQMGLSAVSVHRALHSLEDGLRCPLFRKDGRALIPLATAYAFAEHDCFCRCSEGSRSAYLTRPSVVSVFCIWICCVAMNFSNSARGR